MVVNIFPLQIKLPQIRTVWPIYIILNLVIVWADMKCITTNREKKSIMIAFVAT